MNGDLMHRDVLPRMPHPLTPIHGPESVGFPPSSFVSTVLRCKGTIALFAIGCALATCGVSSTRTRIYRAHTSLEFEGVNDNVLNTRNVDPSATGDNSSQAYINTQARILQSSPLLERAVRRVRGVAQTKIKSERGRQALKNLTAKSLYADLDVRSGDTSRIVDIYVESPDPEVATEIANAIPSEYMTLTLESRIGATKQTGAWLDQQLGEARGKLEQSEAALQAYARKSNLVFTHEDGSVAEDRLRDLQAEYSKAEAERLARQAAYEAAQQGEADALTAALKDTALQEYRAKLTDLNRQMADLSTVYQPTNQKVKRLASQIEEVQRAYDKQRAIALNSVRNDFETAQRHEEMLKRAYLGQQGQVTAEASNAVNYNILKREVETNRTIYQGMLQNVTSYGIASAMQPNNARVVEPADVPLFPYKPNVPLMTVFGLMGGAFLGVVWVGVRDNGEINVEHPGQTRTVLKALELGVIPSARLDRQLGAGRVRVLQSASSSGHALALKQQIGMAMSHSRFSLLAESIRSIRTSLLSQRAPGGPLKSIVITSLTPGQGKTSFVSNLGIAYAELKKRVLLIDGDVRNPGLHKILGLKNDLGLTTLLDAGEAHKPEQLVQAAGIPNLSLLSSGPLRGRTPVSSLFHSDQMMQLMEYFKDSYDVVLIDTPPLTIADARILGPLADGVILVLRAGDVRMDSVQAAEEGLSQDGCRLVGTVLNDWNPRSNGYGIYSERYHKSAYYKTIVRS